MTSDFGSRFDIDIVSDVTVEVDVSPVSLDDVAWNDCVASGTREVWDVGKVSGVSLVYGGDFVSANDEVSLIGVVSDAVDVSDVIFVLDVVFIFKFVVNVTS